MEKAFVKKIFKDRGLRDNCLLIVGNKIYGNSDRLVDKKDIIQRIITALKKINDTK